MTELFADELGVLSRDCVTAVRPMGAWHGVHLVLSRQQAYPDCPINTTLQ